MPSYICSDNSSFSLLFGETYYELVLLFWDCGGRENIFLPVEEERIFFQDTKSLEIEPFVILNSFKINCPSCGCVYACVEWARERGMSCKSSLHTYMTSKVGHTVVVCYPYTSTHAHPHIYHWIGHSVTSQGTKQKRREVLVCLEDLCLCVCLSVLRCPIVFLLCVSVLWTSPITFNIFFFVLFVFQKLSNVPSGHPEAELQLPPIAKSRPDTNPVSLLH